MLERLFISKVRVKLLNLFVNNLDQEYHVRGLVRILGEEINAIRRELKNLEAMGLLISEPKANKIVYRINTRCPFVTDLKAMFMKDTPLSQKLIELLKNYPEIKITLLTNNFLNNKYEFNTDVDILFVGQADLQRLSISIEDLEKEMGRKFRVTVLSEEDFEFRKKKRDQFIVTILQGEKVVLLGNDKNLLLN